MQNEPNLQNTQIDVTSFMTANYDNFHPLDRQKNEPNLWKNKPNSTQFYTQTTDAPISLVKQLNTCIFEAVLVKSGKINDLYQKGRLER